MVQLSFPQPARAEHGLHSSADAQRINPEAVGEFARDLSSLLELASKSDFGDERSRRLNEILESFELLFADMRQLRADISRSLEKCSA